MENTVVIYATGLTNVINVPGSTRKIVYVNGTIVAPTSTTYSTVTLPTTPAKGVPVQVNYDSPAGSQDVVISSALTIGADNASQYNGRTLVFSSALTLTLSSTLPADFGCAILPPATGAATIAFAPGVTGNGGTTSLTRTAAANAAFAIISDRRAANGFIVTGA